MIIKENMTAELCRDNTMVDIPVRLQYDTEDPWAVNMMFFDESGAVCPGRSWRFSAELLQEGLAKAVGVGDVRICPWRCKSFLVTLISPDGQADLLLPDDKYRRFAGLIKDHIESAHTIELMEKELDDLVAGQ